MGDSRRPTPAETGADDSNPTSRRQMLRLAGAAAVGAAGASVVTASSTGATTGTMMQPPSIYKYFPSLIAVYDALFRRGQLEHLDVMRQAMAGVEKPGLDALTAGLEASGRRVLANRATAQLMFWRPVPSFEPSAEAFAPSVEMVALQRAAMADAVAAGQLGPEADSEEAVCLVSTLIVGALTQAMANEPDLEWGQGRFTPTFPRLMKLLAAAYPVPTAASKRRSGAR